MTVDLSRRGFVASAATLAAASCAGIVRDALGAIVVPDDAMGTLRVMTEVLRLGTDPMPTFQFHVLVKDRDEKSVIVDEVIELGADESHDYELPYGSVFTVTRLDDPDGWEMCGQEGCEGWVLPNGVRTAKFTYWQEIGSVDFEVLLPGYDDQGLFKIVVWDRAGEVWFSEVLESGAGLHKFLHAPKGYRYLVTYEGGKYCHLEWENQEGTVKPHETIYVTATWHPHGHVMVTKELAD